MIFNEYKITITVEVKGIDVLTKTVYTTCNKNHIENNPMVKHAVEIYDKNDIFIQEKEDDDTKGSVQ